MREIDVVCVVLFVLDGIFVCLVATSLVSVWVISADLIKVRL